MIRRTFLAFILLITLFSLLTISCNIAIEDCGPFQDKFKTTGFNAGVVKMDMSSNSLIGYEFLSADTVRASEFGLSLSPWVEYYASNTISSPASFSFFPKAYACSPPIAVSEEVITDIQIFSSSSYNASFDAEDNLSELFDIVVLYEQLGPQKYSLNDFLLSEPTVPDLFILIPKTAPESTSPISFTIRYFQDGIDMSQYEYTSTSKVIIP